MYLERSNNYQNSQGTREYLTRPYYIRDCGQIRRINKSSKNSPILEVRSRQYSPFFTTPSLNQQSSAHVKHNIRPHPLINPSPPNPLLPSTTSPTAKPSTNQSTHPSPNAKTKMSYLNRLNSLLTSTTSRYDSLRRNILSSSSEDDSVRPSLPIPLSPIPISPPHPSPQPTPPTNPPPPSFPPLPTNPPTNTPAPHTVHHLPRLHPRLPRPARILYRKVPTLPQLAGSGSPHRNTTIHPNPFSVPNVTAKRTADAIADE